MRWCPAFRLARSPAGGAWRDKRGRSVFATLLPFASAVTLAGLSVDARAEWPERPVRVIVPYAAGGGSDTAAREISHRLTDVFGQSFIVENRPGGATQIGTQVVTRAAPDGYTLLLGTANLATNPLLYEKLPYDARRDLAPISLITRAPVYLLVPGDSPLRDVKTMVDAASQANGLNYGTAGNGSIPHLAAELFRSETATRLSHVPFKGSSEAVTALAGSQLDLGFDN